VAGALGTDVTVLENDSVSKDFPEIMSPQGAFSLDSVERTFTPETTLGLETITRSSQQLMAMSGLSGRINSVEKLAFMRSVPTFSRLFYPIC
jgi:hypothetical protein